MPVHFSDIRLLMWDSIEGPSHSWLISNFLTPTDAFSLKLTSFSRHDKQAEKTDETWGCLARNKGDELGAGCSHSCHGDVDHQSVFGRNTTLIFLLREVVHNVVTPIPNTDYNIVICMDFVKSSQSKHICMNIHKHVIAATLVHLIRCLGAVRISSYYFVYWWI